MLQGHSQGVCRFRSRVCFQCGMKGHLRSMCLGEPARPIKRPQAVKQVAEQQPDQDSNDDFTLWTITGDQKVGYHVNVLVNSKHVQMELDTGAAVSVVSEQEWNELFPEAQIDHYGGGPPRGYSGQQLDVKRQKLFEVQYGRQALKLLLIVIGGRKTIFAWA